MEKEGRELMGTAERRLEILKYLCRHRCAKIGELARQFQVSRRTIQRDILEIEIIFHVPVEVKSGKYGGVQILNNYSFDKMYMTDEEVQLLKKIQDIVKGILSDDERCLLNKVISEYSKQTSKSK